MTRTPGKIAEEVARVEALRDELRATPLERKRKRRHLRRAIARGRQRVAQMLHDAEA